MSAHASDKFVYHEPGLQHQFDDMAQQEESKAELQAAIDWMFPLTVEWFGLPDNLMMIHTLDLHGARLVTPRRRPQDIWHDLTSFEACVALAADRATGKSN